MKNAKRKITHEQGYRKPEEKALRAILRAYWATQPQSVIDVDAPWEIIYEDYVTSGHVSPLDGSTLPKPSSARFAEKMAYSASSDFIFPHELRSLPPENPMEPAPQSLAPYTLEPAYVVLDTHMPVVEDPDYGDGSLSFDEPIFF